MHSITGSGRGFWVNTLGGVILVGLLTSFFLMPSGADPVVMWACLAIFYVCFALQLAEHQEVRPGYRSVFTVEILFMSFYYLVFYWPYQRHVVGQWDVAYSNYTVNTFPEESNRAIVLATVGLIAFLLGSRLARLPRRNRGVLLKPEASDPPYATYVFVGQVALICIYLAAGWRSAGEGRYTGTAAGGPTAEAVAAIILGLCMVGVALFCIEAGRGRLRFIHWMTLAVSLVWASRLAILGDRNSFTLVALVLLVGLCTLRFRVPRWSLFLALALGLAAYFGLESTRFLDNPTLNDVWQEIVDPANQERRSEGSFNITTITLRAAIASVPDVFDYGYGRFALTGLGSTIPFIRGALIPDDEQFITTSNMLTYVVLSPTSTWGVGTNIVADLYIDFGPIGVVVIMALLGWFAGALGRRAGELYGSSIALTIYLLMVALFAELPRYGLGFPFRILAWMALLLWAIQLIHPRRLYARAPVGVSRTAHGTPARGLAGQEAGARSELPNA